MENKELSLAQQKKKDLFIQKKNGYDKLAEGELARINEYCEGYKTFLDEGKTERECVNYAIALAEAAGFKPLVRGMELKPGDKVYANNRGRAPNLAVTAPDELRVRRIMARDNISEEYAWMRVNAQNNSAWFQERCDYNLHNTEEDTVELFAERARALFRTILEG